MTFKVDCHYEWFRLIRWWRGVFNFDCRENLIFLKICFSKFSWILTIVACWAACSDYPWIWINDRQNKWWLKWVFFWWLCFSDIIFIKTYLGKNSWWRKGVKNCWRPKVETTSIIFALYISKSKVTMKTHLKTLMNGAVARIQTVRSIKSSFSNIRDLSPNFKTFSVLRWGIDSTL